MKLTKKETEVIISALYTLCNIELTEITAQDRIEYTIASNLIDRLEDKTN